MFLSAAQNLPGLLSHLAKCYTTASVSFHTVTTGLL